MEMKGGAHPNPKQTHVYVVVFPHTPQSQWCVQDMDHTTYRAPQPLFVPLREDSPGGKTANRDRVLKPSREKQMCLDWAVCLKMQ